MSDYSRTVATQAALDQAIKDKVRVIEVRSPAGVWLEIGSTNSSTVTACDSSTVRACDSSTVTAYNSSTVRAYDSSTVTAYDSSTVTAYDSSTVTAYGSSTVRACDSSTVRASSHVAIHLHSSTVIPEGGVVIDHTKIDLTDLKTWCEYQGIEVDGKTAYLYKAVDDNWTTEKGFDYSPGSTPVAPDFNRRNECGGGLHFGPSPAHALAYNPRATRFVRVGVALRDLVPITTGATAKAKAKKVTDPCVEVDMHMRPVERESVTA
jgi:hypothetical protein